MARKRIPSQAVMVGTVAGGGIGQIIVQAAQEFGVGMGPATASIATILLSLAFGYFSRGGRKGEAD